ncbi:phosphatidate cytidylyltransferase [Solimonas terrae]|uniref:Phosphatidate cytidylyltransferase n=1 Tax=Solimonas terrae TaxID=1396819 RepID=A0A6M2BMP2_9GAMM|nr:phosphatidate cytidylyltransferase [Solimonas terrae]NGY03560.1 phosphatidate cytidylyltransferase [Solimonas terrae]
MLMQRVLTALLLLPVLLALVWFAPTPWLYAALGGIGLVMAWEWTAFMGLSAHTPLRVGYLALTALVLATVWFSPVNGPALNWALAPVALIWLLMPLRFRAYSRGGDSGPIATPVMAIAGQLMIASTLLSVAALHALPNGPIKLLFVLFLVFAADTGAYFAGRSFGRRKLAPKISPGKTIEGAIGGLLLCALWGATAGSFAFGLHAATAIATLIALSVLVAIVSIIGDLTESMLKRIVGLKDSGHILPGHGGILDRVDSIVAAAPVMLLGLRLCGLA